MNNLSFWQWVGTGAVVGSVITFLGVAYRANLIRKSERERIEIEKETAARNEMREDFRAITDGLIGQVSVLREHQEGLQKALNGNREKYKEAEEKLAITEEKLAVCLKRCAECEQRDAELQKRVDMLESRK